MEMVKYLADPTGGGGSGSTITTTTTTTFILLQNTSTTTTTPPTSTQHQLLGPGGAGATAPVAFALAFLSPLALATALVNGGVMAAVCSTRKLRLPANYLICSLALTDFLVGALVMPPAALYVATGAWRLGGAACEAWLSVDMTCCTCSILHLCAIALDRYWAVTKAAAEYARRRSARRAALMIAAAWLLSVFISLPPLFWRRGSGRAAADDDDDGGGGGGDDGGGGGDECAIRHDHVGYTLYSTLGAFYVPMAVILVLYRRIYRAARTLYQKRGSSCRNLRNLGSQGSVDRCRGQPPPQLPPPQPFCVSDARLTADVDADTLRAGVRSVSDGELAAEGRGQQGGASRRERKAAGILGLILGAFVLCWLPFFLKELLVGLRLARPAPPRVSDVLAWLGYANSLVNPLLYTSFNEDFMRAFRKLLRRKAPA